MQVLQGELFVFKLLTQVFSAEPSLKLLQELSRVELSDEQRSQGFGQLVQAINYAGEPLEQLHEALSVEFARLFLGPLKPIAVPYASWYLSETRRLMTDETISVRQRYLDAGMAVKELYSTPDDYIGIELDFLAYLTTETLNTCAAGSDPRADELRKIKDSFIVQHMQKWIPDFVSSLDRSDAHPFYKGAALLLEEVIMNQELPA